MGMTFMCHSIYAIAQAVRSRYVGSVSGVALCVTKNGVKHAVFCMARGMDVPNVMKKSVKMQSVVGGGRHWRVEHVGILSWNVR